MLGDPERDESSPEPGTIRALSVSPILGLFVILLTGFWVLIGAFVYLTNQDENALTTSWQKALRPAVQTIAPEQWAFFTKSPREESLVPYAYEEKTGWALDALFPHSQPQYVFGLNRVSRAQGLELGILYAEIVDREWTTCDDGSESTLDCLGQVTEGSGASWVKISNPSPAPTICGRGAVARETPVPWAYARIGQTQTEPLVMLIDVSC